MDNNNSTKPISTSDLVNYAGDFAKWSFESGNNLLCYLNTLSKFSDYSLNNQLLIMGYKYDATYIKGWYDWPELGVTINNNATPILIIEPLTDGGGGFQIKYMCDASDTNYKYIPDVPDKLSSLEALLTDQENEIVVVDEIKQNGVRSMYMPDTKEIYVRRSSKTPPDEFFKAISGERVHAIMAREVEGVYKRPANQLTAMATTYALGLKYGIDVDNINLSNLPERYSKLSPKSAKTELGKISNCFKEIDDKMQMSLEIIKRREVTAKDER